MRLLSPLKAVVQLSYSGDTGRHCIRRILFCNSELSQHNPINNNWPHYFPTIAMSWSHTGVAVCQSSTDNIITEDGDLIKLETSGLCSVRDRRHISSLVAQNFVEHFIRYQPAVVYHVFLIVELLSFFFLSPVRSREGVPLSNLFLTVFTMLFPPGFSRHAYLGWHEYVSSGYSDAVRY